MSRRRGPRSASNEEREEGRGGRCDPSGSSRPSPASLGLARGIRSRIGWEVPAAVSISTLTNVAATQQDRVRRLSAVIFFVLSLRRPVGAAGKSLGGWSRSASALRRSSSRDSTKAEDRRRKRRFRRRNQRRRAVPRPGSEENRPAGPLDHRFQRRRAGGAGARCVERGRPDGDAPWPGAMARMPPPTPLLPGRPTRKANSPELS